MAFCLDGKTFSEVLLASASLPSLPGPRQHLLRVRIHCLYQATSQVCELLHRKSASLHHDGGSFCDGPHLGSNAQHCKASINRLARLLGAGLAASTPFPKTT